ncbi:MAG: polymer-forming cytoskeletal protein [Anaerolineae bacterium]
MFRKEKRPPDDRLETVIGRNASFNGHFKCEGNLRIDGVCEGSIEATGTVIIGEMAKVMADITAQNVSVSGAVKGKITASDRLEILSTGRVWGSVDAISFLIDEGGYFRGESVMSGEPEPSLVEGP